jgi:phage pi2 protein 07
MYDVCWIYMRHVLVPEGMFIVSKVEYSDLNPTDVF